MLKGAHLPKTLAGTGKGRPRLRPRRPKCGGGGWRKPLAGGTNGTPGAVEAVWQPGAGYVGGMEQDLRARRCCLRIRRSRLRASRMPSETSSIWLGGPPWSARPSVCASVEVKDRALSRVSWNANEPMNRANRSVAVRYSSFPLSRIIICITWMWGWYGK